MVTSLLPEGDGAPVNHDAETEVLNREIDTETENPGVKVAEIVRELEGKEATELSAIYERVDGVLDHLFSTPPSQTARMRIEFTYETYRITVEQNGSVTLVK
ncbi:hypothetical protein BRC97_00785 [Halobacteriales archaeon QS_6_71_20]|nr:MAG: hypothetical protein BRC97_00785 [Halobacteriales archaeon QS_6_71_20]